MYQDHCYFHCCAGVPITLARHSAETCFFCTHLMESFLANEFCENHSITPIVLRGVGKVTQVKLLLSQVPFLFNSEGYIVRGTQTIQRPWRRKEGGSRPRQRKTTGGKEKNDCERRILLYSFWGSYRMSGTVPHLTPPSPWCKEVQTIITF